MPLAWAVVESEDQASWEYFFSNLQNAVPEISSEACVLVSSRDKGTAGQMTSNVADLLNKVVEEEGTLPITDLLNELWHRVMSERYIRFEEARRQQGKGAVVTPFCASVLSEGRKWAQSCSVQQFSPVEARVIQTDRLVNFVNLDARSCGCGRFQQDGIPCGHAMSFIFKLGQSLDAYVPAELTIARWVETYSEPMRPVDISGLRPRVNIEDEEWVDNDEQDAASAPEPCNPPETGLPRGRGRPRKRMDKEQYRASRGGAATHA